MYLPDPQMYKSPTFNLLFQPHITIGHFCMWQYQKCLADTKIQCCYKGLTFLDVCHCCLKFVWCAYKCLLCRILCVYLGVSQPQMSVPHLYFICFISDPSPLRLWLQSQSVFSSPSVQSQISPDTAYKVRHIKNSAQIICIHFFSVTLHESDSDFVSPAAAAFPPQWFILLLFDWDSSIPRVS